MHSPGNLTMPVNQSRSSFIKSLVDLMELAASGAEAGLVVAAVVGNRCRMWGICARSCGVMAQFIFMSASFSLEGRPRMVGPGVSATYQYEFTLGG